MPPKVMLTHAIESFATYLRVERNLSPRTRQAYGYELGRFATWLAEARHEAKTPLAAVASDHVHEYINFVRTQLGYKAATANRVVSSLRVFFAYCVEEKLLDASPAQDLVRPKLPQKLPIYLIPQEIQRLFDAPDRSTPLGRRDYTILITLAYTGMRLQELVGLNTIALDFSRGTILVYGKGSKERLIPMNEEVEAALRAMLEDPERVVATGERAVFLNARGKRMSGRAVQYLVDRYVEQAGISKDKISPHKLRHTFATLLHARNVDLVDIQSLMGHASLVSTQIYTHTNVGRLQKAIDLLEVED